MSMGTLTFGSIARMNDYRSLLALSAKQRQAKPSPISKASSQIPTGKVDARTEQALEWSGLRTKGTKNDSSKPSYLAGLNTFSSEIKTPNYQAPDLELAYSFSSIKKILAYRDSLEARSDEQNIPSGISPESS